MPPTTRYWRKSSIIIRWSTCPIGFRSLNRRSANGQAPPRPMAQRNSSKSIGCICTLISSRFFRFPLQQSIVDFSSHCTNYSRTSPRQSTLRYTFQERPSASSLHISSQIQLAHTLRTSSFLVLEIISNSIPQPQEHTITKMTFCQFGDAIGATLYLLPRYALVLPQHVRSIYFTFRPSLYAADGNLVFRISPFS